MGSMSVPRDPEQSSKFHGSVALRRPVEKAVFVLTQPSPGSEADKRLHYHEYPYFWLLVRGACEETIDGLGDRDYRRGVWTYHPQGERHAHRCGGDQPTGLGIVLQPALLELLRSYGPVADHPAVLEDSAACLIGQAVLRELQDGDLGSDLALEGLTLLLLSQLSRTKVKRDKSAPDWLRRARDLVHDRFAEELRVSDIAREVGIHPVHLSREFSRHYGETPGAMMRNLRLRAAESMLRRTDMPLASVASRCGFYDEAHFCRSFKAAMGQTPGAFRASLRRSS
jgi:AraC family transcriptional regulator